MAKKEEGKVEGGGGGGATSSSPAAATSLPSSPAATTSKKSSIEEGKGGGGYGSSPHMKTVALSILVMGVSLAIVILLWVSFGYIGPSFSSNRLLDQQAQLREQYGLPPQPPVPKNLLEVPPSERGLGGSTAATAGVNTTTTNASSVSGINATAATNSTTATANNASTAINAGNITSSRVTNGTSAATTNATSTAAAAAGGGNSVKIVSGAATKTTDAFSPNPLEVKVGTNVTWTNGDTQPHTVTSGTGPSDTNKGKEFDTSPNLNPLFLPGKTFSHTFSAAGTFPYFCQLHPNMVGSVKVS